MALDDTTLPDVPHDESNPTPDAPPLSDRELALEAIGQRHHQQLAEENGVTLDPDADQLAAQLDGESAPPAPAAPPAAPATPTAPAPEGAAPTVVKVKIDGVEAEVPLDEVVRNYQKTSAADKRLADATRLQREAAEQAAAVAAAQQQLMAQLQQQAAPAPATPDPSPAPGQAPEAGKEFLKALFEGDEETALAKLAELTSPGRQAPQAPAIPDIHQLTDAVARHVQQQLHVDSALAQHRKDYPQIYADPDMEGFVLTKVQSVRQQTGSDFFTALHDVSAQFAQKFGWTQPAQDPGRPNEPAPTTNTAREAKLERKAAIDNVRSANTTPHQSDTEPTDPSSVIAQMQRTRVPH